MNNTPKTLQEAIQYYSDEQVCIDTVASLRWSDGKPTCPACGHEDHYYLKTQRRWKCKECWKQFSVKLGTIFEDSPLSLTKWLPTLWMLVNCKNGISSYEVSRAIGVSQKSSWFMLHRIRFAMKSGSIEKLGKHGYPVEMDEVYIGGNPQKMHKARLLRLRAIASNTPGVSSYAPGKTIVHGMLDRKTRQVRAQVIPNVKRETLQNLILNNVTRGAEIHTDELTTYKFAIAKPFVHEVINHSVEYVNKNVHTQGIENFWSLLKRGLRGTYVAVEPFHLDRYLDEQVFRFNNRKDENNRKISDGERFEIALSQIGGKRLTFADVTGKTL
jgi:transposase-like protein